MARIRWILETETTGYVARIYDAWKAANTGRLAVPVILKSLSLRPELLVGMIEVVDRVQFLEGYLSRRIKEMIATYVSALNRCPYRIGSHAYFLQLQDPSPGLHECLARAELERAPVSDAERALLRFVEAVTVHAYRT